MILEQGVDKNTGRRGCLPLQALIKIQHPFFEMVEQEALTRNGKPEAVMGAVRDIADNVHHMLSPRTRSVEARDLQDSKAVDQGIVFIESFICADPEYPGSIHEYGVHEFVAQAAPVGLEMMKVRDEAVGRLIIQGQPVTIRGYPELAGEGRTGYGWNDPFMIVLFL